eukprot:TRINITY_DN7342_c0_g3_i1.p1 TRINITY_DN7342_c0_g3~~TRINITY_DN7342_c0_g3_i1.p1  ORF type:complete len:638 (+),score=104.39 TRINITY_DN7342_c0_g3_i1:87-2000(+)
MRWGWAVLPVFLSGGALLVCRSMVSASGAKSAIDLTALRGAAAAAAAQAADAERAAAAARARAAAMGRALQRAERQLAEAGGAGTRAASGPKPEAHVSRGGSFGDGPGGGERSAAAPPLEERHGAAAAARPGSERGPAATPGGQRPATPETAPHAAAQGVSGAGGAAPATAPAAPIRGLGWAMGGSSNERTSALRRYTAAKTKDDSDFFQRMEPMLGLSGLPEAARPLRTYYDEATGLTIALGMMAHTLGPRLCSVLYQLQVMGWPVNLVGPVLTKIENEVPIRTLRFREDVNLPWLRLGIPRHAHSGVNEQYKYHWMQRKHFVFADMANLAEPGTLLVLIDGGDVFAQLPPSAFAAAWAEREQQLGRGVVALGADYGCFPFDSQVFGCGRWFIRLWNLTARPCGMVSNGRLSNGGLFAGRAEDVSSYLNSFAHFVAAVPRVCYVPEDQAMFYLYFLDTKGMLSGCRGCRKTPQTGGPHAVLDFNETLFACLLYVGGVWRSPKYERTSGAPGAPFAQPGARRPPALLHFAGRDGKLELDASGLRLGSEAGLFGFWGPLGMGQPAEAERLAAQAEGSELAVDGRRAVLGEYCSPPTAGARSQVRQGWAAAEPLVESTHRVRTRRMRGKTGPTKKFVPR